MDAATLTVELVKALAWPVAAIVLLVMLRKPSAELLPLAKKLKYGEFEMEFNQDVRELAERAEKELPAPAAAARAREEPFQNLRNLARISPRTAVMESWSEVERAAARLIATRNIPLDTDSPTPYLQIERKLDEHKLVTRGAVALFSLQRLMRNKVVHAREYEITPEQASVCVEVGLKLKGYLDEQATDG